MLRRLYDWTLRMAVHPRAELVLTGVSFAESSFFPIPPDVMLAPMILADRSKAWRYAAICTVASVLGGAFGYFIGLLLFDTLGQWILTMYGLQESFKDVAARYNELGWLMVFIGGCSPIPYKVITILSGLTHLNFAVFMLVSVVSRTLRFLIACGVFYWAGPRARDILERRLGLAVLIFFVVVIGGFVAVKYMF